MNFKTPLKDRIALSAVSGLLGTLVMYAIGIPLYLLKITETIYLSYNVELFITHKLAKTMPGFIFGFFSGLIVGSALALGLKLLFEWTGTDWIWLKAVGYGAVMWYFWVGVARNFLDLTPYLFFDIRTNVVLLLQSIVYSLATTYFMIKLRGDKNLLSQREK